MKKKKKKNNNNNIFFIYLYYLYYFHFILFYFIYSIFLSLLPIQSNSVQFNSFISFSHNVSSATPPSIMESGHRADVVTPQYTSIPAYKHSSTPLEEFLD